jgi:hypothetical protein
MPRVAGTGTIGATGDDGPPTAAQLQFPSGLAAISQGGFLIANASNRTVRKVSVAGLITRVAGTGTPGASGDDGPATDAQLDEPVEVTITADGGFLVTDFHNHTVRKVLPVD